MFLFSFVNPDARAARRARSSARSSPTSSTSRCRTRCMPRGPGVRAGVDHARQRVRRAPDRRATSTSLGERLRAAGYGGPAADHAVDRRRHAARLRRAAGGHAARLGPDRRRDGRRPRRPQRPGVGDFVAVDMGGTSFDICLVRGGRPEIKTDWNWRYRYYIGLPMVDVQSVGAGGGSIARVRQGALLVGPESRRARRPGRPATGGAATRPTVTDADAVLGYLPVDGLRRRAHDARRRRRPRGHRARRRPSRSALDVDRGGVGHRAHRQRQHGQRHPPGAGRLRRRPPRPRAHRLRRQRRGARAGPSPPSSASTASSCPKAAPAFSALGLLVADYVVDLVRAYVVPLSPGRPRPAARR